MGSEAGRAGATTQGCLREALPKRRQVCYIIIEINLNLG